MMVLEEMVCSVQVVHIKYVEVSQTSYHFRQLSIVENQACTRMRQFSPAITTANLTPRPTCCIQELHQQVARDMTGTLTARQLLVEAKTMGSLANWFFECPFKESCAYIQYDVHAVLSILLGVPLCHAVSRRPQLVPLAVFLQPVQVALRARPP